MKTSTQCFYMLGVAAALAACNYFLPEPPLSDPVILGLALGMTFIVFQPFVVWGTLADLNWRIRVPVAAVDVTVVAYSASKFYRHMPRYGSDYPFGQPTLWQSILCWFGTVGFIPLLTAVVLALTRHAGCKLAQQEQMAIYSPGRPQFTLRTLWVGVTASAVLVGLFVNGSRLVDARAFFHGELLAVIFSVAPLSLLLTLMLIRAFFGAGLWWKRSTGLIALVSLPIGSITALCLWHDSMNNGNSLSRVLPLVVAYASIQVGILSLALLPFKLNGYCLCWEQGTAQEKSVAGEDGGPAES